MNQQDKRDLLTVLIGIVLGIAVTVATVTIVNERRFSARCHERGGVVVEYGTWGKNYCINPDALNKENN